MECSEARRLIDEGVRPGSTSERRAALGFHLAGCAACRDYQSPPNATDLLAALLAEEPPAGSPSGVAPPVRRSAPRPAPPRPLRRRQPRPWPWWRYLLVGAVGVLVFGFALVVGRITMAAYTIRENVAAMQITAAPRVAVTPTLRVPTAPPLPSPTPLPATGVLDAPASSYATPDAGLPTDAAATATPQAAGAVVAAVVASPTPIRLPSIGGPGVLPTLMPTVGVVPMSGTATTILLLGSDRRPGEGWETRSDAIIVVRLEPSRQRVAMLSLPRDLIVSIPGYGQSRINAATVYGEMYPELGGGAELARQTVSSLLGVQIDHVVRADFTAFMTAVDAIGGIDLVVEQELYDPQYPTMDYGYMVAHFLPGPQHFDGELALIYSRMRHSDSDYARARRQQQVIQAILQRVREQNVLGQVQMLTNLSSALRDNIQTDLSLDQMIGMAWAFRNLPPEMVERYTLDENMTYIGAPGDPYAIFASPGAIQTVTNQLLNSQ